CKGVHSNLASLVLLQPKNPNSQSAIYNPPDTVAFISKSGNSVISPLYIGWDWSVPSGLNALAPLQVRPDS
ncbi:MAG: hypothetical protein ACR2PH_17940, partial [Desulfobulbia bacterium]